MASVNKESKPKRNVRLWIALASILAVTILVLQNTEEVETTLLFAKVKMPRAVLLFATFAFGALVGSLLTAWLYRKQRKLTTS